MIKDQDTSENSDLAWCGFFFPNRSINIGRMFCLPILDQYKLQNRNLNCNTWRIDLHVNMEWVVPLQWEILQIRNGVVLVSFPRSSLAAIFLLNLKVIRCAGTSVALISMNLPVSTQLGLYLETKSAPIHSGTKSYLLHHIILAAHLFFTGTNRHLGYPDKQPNLRTDYFCLTTVPGCYLNFDHKIQRTRWCLLPPRLHLSYQSCSTVIQFPVPSTPFAAPTVSSTSRFISLSHHRMHTLHRSYSTLLNRQQICIAYRLPQETNKETLQSVTLRCYALAI